MRKQETETQPFEVIEDEHGRYHTPADLVRPDDDGQDSRPKRWPLILLIWVVIVAVVGLIFVAPAIDREMMRSPMVSLMNGVNAASIEQMRNSFTADGKIGCKGFSFSAGVAIDAAEPYLKDYGSQGNLRFTGFQNLRRLGRSEAEADFTVKVDISDESVPYRNASITRTGHVRLQLVGWFRWKIVYLTSSEPEFEEALGALLLKQTFPFDL
ncbi:MAG: hypothetical protein ACYC6A_12700 [Armatimonadota bacterium]